MNFLIIGDVHGRSLWKTFGDIDLLLKAYFIPDFDKYIFLGDYVDSFDINGAKIIQNLNDIIEFKNKYPLNVELLLGNHDIQYMLNSPNSRNDKYYCTGYKPEFHYELYEIFNKNYNLFNVAYQYKNNIFTHAGIHIGWWAKFVKEMQQFKEKYNHNDTTVAELINLGFMYHANSLFDVDFYRGGDKEVGGPLWCDKHLSSKKPLKDYHQFVGHSRVKNIQKYTINENTSITFCDTQNYEKIHNEEYYLTIKI